MAPVTSIQRPLLLFIPFMVSKVSNMASLRIGFGYSYFRHRGKLKCSRGQK